MRNRRGSVSLIALLLTTGVLAGPPRPMTLVDLVNIPGVTGARLSPDGSEVVYVLWKSDWQKNGRIPHLWLVSTESGESRQFTFGQEGERDPLWSPDGEWILFRSKRPPAEEWQLYLLPRNGGESQQLTRHVTGVSSPQCSGDGSWVYFLADDPEPPEEKRRQELKDDVSLFEQNDQQKHLWRFHLKDKKEYRLTEGDFSVSSFFVSSDPDQVVLHRSPSPLPDDADESEIWLLNVSASASKRLTRNGVEESGGRLSPDRRKVLFEAESNELFEPYYNRNLFLLDPEESSAVPILSDFPYEVEKALWAADGKHVYAVANLGVHSELLSIDLEEGTFRALTQGEHAVSDWDYSRDTETHLLTIEDSKNPGDLWILKGSGELRQLTHHFDYLKKEFLLPRQERIEWRGEDGVVIEGLLIYPVPYRPGQRYPLVVQAHGGPASSDRFGFGESPVHYNPVLAARGYAVLKPNYRGSTGYGNEFLRDMVGHYFHQAHLDVLRGVDHVINMGVADRDRLAIMGWSAGGHLTNKLITFTDRFRAASSGAGAVNWISMYSQSDTRVYRDPWFSGSPWRRDARIDLYWENSPLREIWKARTPTLILVGAEDERVPAAQSVELYRALSSNGVATRLYVAPREGHGWRELRHRLFKMNAELDWFARHVLGQEYEWEAVPEGAADKGDAATSTSEARAKPGE